MHIASCTVKLNLEGVNSLKEKRRILKSILVKIRQQFNVAAAEVDCHDLWQTSVISLVSVGNDARYLQGLMEKAVAWIEKTRPDVPIDAYSIELL